MNLLLALNYIKNEEFKEILKLRIEILIDQHCEDLALNLCAYCVRTPQFADNIFMRKMHLVLLHKLGNPSFHEEVKALFHFYCNNWNSVSSHRCLHTYINLNTRLIKLHLNRCEYFFQCTSIPCCTMVKILNELKNDVDKKSALESICQTALLQNWLHPKSDGYCCTEVKTLACRLRHLFFPK